MDFLLQFAIAKLFEQLRAKSDAEDRALSRHWHEWDLAEDAAGTDSEDRTADEMIRDIRQSSPPPAD